MDKDKDLKIRVSDKDIKDIDFCQAQLGVSKSAVVRLAIEILTEKIKQERGLNDMKNKMYIEEVCREDTGYHANNAWNRDELIEVIQHQLDSNNEDERIAIAENLVKKIDSGESVVLGKTYISEYRIGTEEEIEKAKKEEDAINVEIDAMPIPDIEELRRLTEKYKENHPKER